MSSGWTEITWWADRRSPWTRMSPREFRIRSKCYGHKDRRSLPRGFQVNARQRLANAMVMSAPAPCNGSRCQTPFWSLAYVCDALAGCQPQSEASWIPRPWGSHLAAARAAGPRASIIRPARHQQHNCQTLGGCLACSEAALYFACRAPVLATRDRVDARAASGILPGEPWEIAFKVLDETDRELACAPPQLQVSMRPQRRGVGIPLLRIR